MKRKDAQTVGDFIADFLKDSALGEKLQENRLIKAWEGVLGASIAAYTSRIYIQNRTLYVHLTSSALRGELSMCRTRLIEQLNRAAGADVIDHIILK